LFGPFAESVIDGMTTKPRTIEAHRYALKHHLAPRFGRRKIADIDADAVAKLVREMRAGVHFKDGRRVTRKEGYSGSTIAGVLGTLGLVMGRAKRRHLVGSNPVAELERDERPSIRPKEMRALDDDEITKLLTAGGKVFGPILAVFIFSGMRMGEALGLQWGDIDEDAGLIYVRRQLGRDRKPADSKTFAGRRDIVLIDQLAQVLRKHKIASKHCGDGDFVFAAPDGRGREHRSVSRGIERAVTRAGLGKGISAHTFRHTFISRLIAMGLDPVRVSRQVGHKSAAFTAAVYAHDFERARYANELREQMQAGFGRLLNVNANGNQRAKATRGKTRSTKGSAPQIRLQSVDSAGG
jgi:integrase